jgi:hypothetical protein
MSDGVADDPTYNPFAEHDHEHDRPTTSQGFYRSAFIPSLTRRTKEAIPIAGRTKLGTKKREKGTPKSTV